MIRTLVPVSVRGSDDRSLNNQVSAMIAELPVGIASPLERLAAIRTQMEGLKQSHQAVAANVLVNMADFAPPMLMTLGLRSAATLMRRMPQASVNTVTTNVPGPQVPLYACGREMLSYYPFVPLSQGVRIGVAILSYNGRIAFGVTGDWDTTADLDVMTAGIEHGIAELTDAAIVATLLPLPAAAPARKQTAKRGTAPAAATSDSQADGEARRHPGRSGPQAGGNPGRRMSDADESSASADVVVIGAGVIGCAVALELARRGRQVVVVDKGPAAGAGSTSSSSAVVRFNYSTLENVEALLGIGAALAPVGGPSRGHRRERHGADDHERDAGARLPRHPPRQRPRALRRDRHPLRGSVPGRTAPPLPWARPSAATSRRSRSPTMRSGPTPTASSAGTSVPTPASSTIPRWRRTT